MRLCAKVKSHHKFTSPKVPKFLLLNYHQSCESFKRNWKFVILMKVKWAFLYAITLPNYVIKFLMNVVES